MMFGIGGCGSINHPRTQAGRALLSLARNDSGGALSLALLLALSAWQLEQDLSTSSRPACASAAAKTGRENVVRLAASRMRRRDIENPPSGTEIRVVDSRSTNH